MVDEYWYHILLPCIFIATDIYKHDMVARKEKKLTCTMSIRYHGRILPRLIKACWEIIVALESSVISILSIAQRLSRGGICDCNINKTIIRKEKKTIKCKFQIENTGKVSQIIKIKKTSM